MADLVVASDPIAAAAARVEEAVRAVDAEREAARLAIPGGSAAAVVGAVREALGEVWRRVRLTWVDERCVPRRALDSNRGTAHRNGFLREDDPPAVELALFEDGETPEAACERVAEGLGRELHAGLDVVLLGMGADGHVASLFPGRGEPPGVVAPVYESPKPPRERVTLTTRFLRTARTTVLFATGEAKREALTRVLMEDPKLPASGLPGLVVVTDLELRH